MDFNVLSTALGYLRTRRVGKTKKGREEEEE